VNQAFTIIETPRLYLTDTPLAIIRERLEHDQFTAELPIYGGMAVYFPPQWPGDALDLFAGWAEWLEADPSHQSFGPGLLIHKAERMAVGQIGFKGHPNSDGIAEIGYGLNTSHHRQGYASEAVAALLQWGAAQPSVRDIRAECLPQNIGSVRVLEKNNFQKIYQRFDETENSMVWTWQWQGLVKVQ
jgi:[ribosomal protein S5]-alanine N-acetyltransferase